LRREAFVASNHPACFPPISDGFAALGSGNPARIPAARNALTKIPPDEYGFSIILLAQLGAPQQALALLHEDYAAGDPNLSFLFAPLLEPLRKQPGWLDLLKQAGLIDYWRTSKKPPEFAGLSMRHPSVG
jgi:hypothetical protein